MMKEYDLMERALRKHLPGGKFSDVSPKRSRTMGAIKGKNNRTTERRLRMALVGAGLKGWKLHPVHVLGRPDFFFVDEEVVIFVDGCFWHGCPECGHFPKTNRDYWRAKIERNQKRDRKVSQSLHDAGFTVIRFWEHGLRNDLRRCVKCIIEALGLSHRR